MKLQPNEDGNQTTDGRAGGAMSEYYIVRCVHSGVFFASGLDRDDSDNITYLKWSRMIWSWSGAAALSQVARDGITGGHVCVPVEGRVVYDACETIPCTEVASQNLLNQPEWVAGTGDVEFLMRPTEPWDDLPHVDGNGNGYGCGNAAGSGM